jgi:seryl-tRNA synthetase
LTVEPLERAQRELLKQLIEHGLFIECGVPGVYGRSAVFEAVVDRYEDYVTRVGAPDEPTRVRFPPVMARNHFEISGYLKNMPQLAGTIHSFEGGQREHAALVEALEAGEDWAGNQRLTDLVLTPAACYPVYPMLKGDLPPEGRLMDVCSYCFRREPSFDPARMQLFRMREYVRIGRPEDVREWRERWLERGPAMFGALGLDPQVVLANDPFFGRTGKLLAASQREQELKYELVAPISSAEHPTALLSFNYHQDLFGELYGIRVDGAAAHTACLGFGVDRAVLALFKAHGFDPETWPRHVKDALGT